MDERPAFFGAIDTLEGLQRAAEVVAVLRAADKSGLLRQLLVPGVPAMEGVTPRRIEAVLGLLASFEVVEHVRGVWQLAEPWRPLVAGETPFDLEATLGVGRVRAEQVEKALTSGEDYWQLSPTDRLLVARGMSFDPTSQMATDLARAALEGLPEVVAALDAGGRVLELGCGIGSRMTALLRAFPRARGVGVELTTDLVEAGRERAARLGVGDRLTYVCADATTYEPDGLFDAVQWSQFFFPRPSRRAALATAWRSLRPGGWISMPVVWDGEPVPPASTLDQDLSAERLVLELWDVPLLSTDEVADELRDAGFTDVQVVPGPGVYYLRGRREDS
jgi:SAM-dependent methyltransferase